MEKDKGKAPLVELEKPEPDEMAKAVASYIKNYQLFMEMERAKMKVRKAAYDAALAEGFNEMQALEICKSV